MAVTRRNFVKTSAAGVLAASVTSSFAADSVAGKSEVMTGKGKASDVIPKMFNRLGGMKQFVKPGARVLIKPNMSFSNPPDWGTGTSPEAVRTVVELCLDAGAKRVVVCDNTLRDPELCKEKTGIGKAIEGLKGAVIFIPKQAGMFTAVTSDKAVALKKTDVVTEAQRADCVISLPAAKSHGAAGVSLGIKNLMGLIKERGVMHRDMDLHTAIADLLFYIRPHVTIVDATRALLDNGPAGPGKVAQLDTFVGGLDPVAVDSFAVTLASWYGRRFEGTNVKYIKQAAELGFGHAESSNITEVAV